jgi:hypothetical protein
MIDGQREVLMKAVKFLCLLGLMKIITNHLGQESRFPAGIEPLPSEYVRCVAWCQDKTVVMPLLFRGPKR